ncbi:MAG: hypothetical protein ACYTG6_14850 [Planctomycetota bacterium]|jgi:sugar lactone lactonase YvrE
MSCSALVLLFAVPALAHDWNGIALDASGHVYVIDAEDAQIWKIGPAGEVSVFFPGSEGEPLCHPHHLAMDADGVLWLASG